MKNDARQEQITAEAVMGKNRLIGCYCLHPNVAQASNALRVDLAPGEAIIGGKAQYIAGAEQLKVYDGSTLADGDSIWATVVAYYNPDVNGIFVKVVEGTAALTASVAKPTEAQIAAALPDSDYPFQICGDAKFSRAGSAITVTLDRSRRTFDLNPSLKDVAAAYNFDPVAKAAYYRRFQQFRLISIDAADIADGNVLVIPLPKIYGRIIGGRVVCEKAITTGAKTTALSGKIGSTAVTGLAVTYAGTKALGAVTELSAATANHTFVPGDTFTLVAASTTAFVEGRVAVELDIDELQQ